MKSTSTGSLVVELSRVIRYTMTDSTPKSEYDGAHERCGLGVRAVPSPVISEKEPSPMFPVYRFPGYHYPTEGIISYKPNHAYHHYCTESSDLDS